MISPRVTGYADATPTLDVLLTFRSRSDRPRWSQPGSVLLSTYRDLFVQRLGRMACFGAGAPS